MRELPYGFDVLLENLVDPSHVPFSHSGIIGNRDDAAVSRMTIDSKMTTDGGFVMNLETLKGGASSLVSKDGENVDSKQFFKPPTLTRCVSVLHTASNMCCVTELVVDRPCLAHKQTADSDTWANSILTLLCRLVH